MRQRPRRAPLGGGAIGLSIDVADPQSVKSQVAAALSRVERIDVLVNNAGITRDASLLKTSDEAWDAVIAVNLSGTFYMTREVAPHMVARGSGAIINASSVVGVYGNFGQTNYVATKSGVIGMTRVWARELGRKGRARQLHRARLHRHRHDGQDARGRPRGHEEEDAARPARHAGGRGTRLCLPGLATTPRSSTARSWESTEAWSWEPRWLLLHNMHFALAQYMMLDSAHKRAQVSPITQPDL